jgi:hypothetical protein
MLQTGEAELATQYDIQSPSAGDGDSPAGASLVVVLPDVQGAVTTQPSFELSLEKYRTNPYCESSQAMTHIARSHINREHAIDKHKQDIEDKEYARGLARDKWRAQPTPIHELVDTLLDILRLEKGRVYTQRVVHRWIADLAPQDLRKPGRRRKD